MIFGVIIPGKDVYQRYTHKDVCVCVGALFIHLFIHLFMIRRWMKVRPELCHCHGGPAGVKSFR